MKVSRAAARLDESCVTQAFRNLSVADQTKFLSLHEGAHPYNTKEMRIWKLNSFFGGGDDLSYVYLDISRINHSCVPNVEIDENLEDKTAEIYALRDIATGEELTMCYNAIYNGATRQQRQNMLKACYGFTCACTACEAGEEESAQSDARRKIIHALYHLVAGLLPDDVSYMDNVTPKNVDSYRCESSARTALHHEHIA